jgi:ABC-type uncharacterized transport system permease subunit
MRVVVGRRSRSTASTALAAFVLRHVRIDQHLKLVQTLLEDRIPEVHANAWKALLVLEELDCIPLWFEHLNPLHVADLPLIQAKIEKMGPPAFERVLAVKPRSREEYRQVQGILDALEQQAWQQQGWLGWLKAKTGGHEVINTIMMNYIAFRLSDFLLTGPMKRPGSFNPVSPEILPSAWLPRFFPDPIRFHLGFFIALGIAYLVYWYLFKTTWGFELRTVGTNPNAAKYAGMNVTKNLVLAMSLSGALAGLAGANEVLGVNRNLAMAFSSGYGFDSIALALLGNNHPLGVVLASLLFGTLRSGATRMQLTAGIPNDIISILQAVILAFIAAPAIIRTIYRLRKPTVEEAGVTIRGWGG